MTNNQQKSKERKTAGDGIGSGARERGYELRQLRESGKFTNKSREELAVLADIATRGNI